MADGDHLSDISFSSLHCQGTFRPPHLEISEKNLREIRREIRHGYRKILERSNEVVSSEAPVDSRHITDDVEQANVLLDQVTQPREGSFDSTVIKQCTDLFKKRATQMETRRKFDPELYAKRFIAFAKNMNERDVIAGGNNDNDDESAVTEFTRDDLLKFADFILPVFNPAPAFHYLYGGFSRQPHEFVKVEKLKRSRPDTEKAGPSKPNVKIIEDGGTDDEITARRTEKLKRHLTEAFRQTNNGPVAYFDFVINPHDFSKTVENMFYFSFLVKDGNVSFGLDDKGIPIIEPFSATQHGRRLQDMERKQCIITMDYEEWKDIVDAFEIEEPFFDLDE